MATTLKAKLFAQASAYAPLQALLGAPPDIFRWFDSTLDQDALTTGKSAVVVTQVSRKPVFANLGQLPTDWARMQFTIFGAVTDPNGGADSQSCDAVVGALQQFLPTFNATGITSGGNAIPSFVLMSDRDMGLAETQPRTYQRIVDAMIWSDNNAN